MYDLLMSDFFLIVSLHEVSESLYFVFASTDYDRLTSATYAKNTFNFQTVSWFPLRGRRGAYSDFKLLTGFAKAALMA